MENNPKEIPTTESMEWVDEFYHKFWYINNDTMHERHGDGCKCRSGYRKSIVEYITNLLAAREKEAYQIGKEDGYAESESNYHFEDAEKECIKQTRNETVKECVKAIESINLNEICDDSTVVARNKIIEVLLALRSEKVDDAG